MNRFRELLNDRRNRMFELITKSRRVEFECRVEEQLQKLEWFVLGLFLTYVLYRMMNVKQLQWDCSVPYGTSDFTTDDVELNHTVKCRLFNREQSIVISRITGYTVLSHIGP